MSDERTENSTRTENSAYTRRTKPSLRKLYKHDLMGSIAHCTMLGEVELIPSPDAEVVQRALTKIFYDITNEKLALPAECDVFDFLDSELEIRIGELAKKLNVARTRGDRLALDVRMYVREISSDACEYVKTLVQTLIAVAEVNGLTFIPSVANGGEGQPTTVAHLALGHAEAFMRDIARFKRIADDGDDMPLYSAYGTGLRLPVDKKRVAELLKFKSVAHNVADALVNVDYIRELEFAVELLSKHLIELTERVSGWIASGYALASDALTEPSEIRPLKKLPIAVNALTERLRSVAAVCAKSYGASEIVDLFDYAVEAESEIKAVIPQINDLVASLTFDLQASLKAAQAEYSTARDCVDYLLAKGESKDEAENVVTKLCVYCRDNGKRLDTLPLEVYKDFSEAFEADVVSDMKVRNAVRLRKSEGEPSDVSTRAEIRSLNKRLNKIFG